MKIALIIENSQAAKSDMVHTALSNVAEFLRSRGASLRYVRRG